MSGIQPSCSPKQPDFPAPANYVEHAAPVSGKLPAFWREAWRGAAALAGKNPRGGRFCSGLRQCAKPSGCLRAPGLFGRFWRELRNDSDDRNLPPSSGCFQKSDKFCGTWSAKNDEKLWHVLRKNPYNKFMEKYVPVQGGEMIIVDGRQSDKKLSALCQS